jgi:hypothetical protein
MAFDESQSRAPRFPPSNRRSSSGVSTVSSMAYPFARACV